MNTVQLSDRPIRVGVFDEIAEADQVVHELQALGFRAEQITVVCSSEAVQRHFAEFEHQDPAGTYTPKAALLGGACGAGLAGLAATAIFAGAATGGLGLLAIGGIALWGGGVVGGLVGAMMTRGVEKELANFYNQAVQDGKILVAAEQEDPKRHEMLAPAAEIFAAHGSEPLPLPQG